MCSVVPENTLSAFTALREVGMWNAMIMESSTAYVHDLPTSGLLSTDRRRLSPPLSSTIPPLLPSWEQYFSVVIVLIYLPPPPSLAPRVNKTKGEKKAR